MIIDHQLFLQLEKRVADAEPCHNYRDNGEGPEGCWWCWNFEIYVSINNKVIKINSPITWLDRSIDSTSAKILYNQLPSWHNECFNQVNLFNRLLIIYHRLITKTAFMTRIEYAFLFFTNSGCKSFFQRNYMKMLLLNVVHQSIVQPHLNCFYFLGSASNRKVWYCHWPIYLHNNTSSLFVQASCWSR